MKILSLNRRSENRPMVSPLLDQLRLRAYSLIFEQMMRSWVLLILMSRMMVEVAPFSDEPREIRLVVTGDVQGTFEPCGCAGGPTGGLARRLGYVKAIIREDQQLQSVFQVDAGNYLEQPGPNSKVINGLLKASLSDLPIAVLNLGADDLFWWKELSLAQFSETQIISTNLVPKSSSTPSPKPFAIVEASLSGPDGPQTARLGFVGLVDPALVKPNSPFRAEDPIQAMAEVKDEVLSRADFIVVLFDTIRPRGRLPAHSPIRQIAESHDEVYLIITTEKRFVLYEAEQINSALVLSTVERGRYLADIRLRFDADKKLVGIQPDFIEMKVGVPEDPVLLARQRSVSAQLR